uniref:Uncharacterized protein n=1 Tax=Populus trichocarpa TaxID=3694 RepID=A0A3N7EVA8_POPTR
MVIQNSVACFCRITHDLSLLNSLLTFVAHTIAL